MATDRYGNPIGVMDSATDRYGNPVSSDIHQRSISNISYQDFVPEGSQSDTQRDNENERGYEGGSVGDIGKGLAIGVGVGQAAMGLAGRSFGIGGNIGIDAVEGVLSGKDVESVGTKAAWGAAKIGAGLAFGPAGRAAVSIGKAEDPAQKAISIGASTLGSVLGGAIAGPIGAMLGGLLGDVAASNIDDIGSAIGDVTDSRKHEATLDALEDAGYSYGEGRDATSGEKDAKGTGGTPTERASTELGRASGDSGLGNDAGGFGSSGEAGRDSDADAGFGGGTADTDSGDNDGHGE